MILLILNLKHLILLGYLLKLLSHFCIFFSKLLLLTSQTSTELSYLLPEFCMISSVFLFTFFILVLCLLLLRIVLFNYISLLLAVTCLRFWFFLFQILINILYHPIEQSFQPCTAFALLTSALQFHSKILLKSFHFCM
jgi:hypothetical protein